MLTCVREYTKVLSFEVVRASGVRAAWGRTLRAHRAHRRLSSARLDSARLGAAAAAGTRATDAGRDEDCPGRGCHRTTAPRRRVSLP